MAFLTEIGNTSKGAVYFCFVHVGMELIIILPLELLYLRYLVEMSNKQLEYQKMKGIFLDLTELLTFTVIKWIINIWIFNFIMSLNKSFSVDVQNCHSSHFENVCVFFFLDVIISSCPNITFHFMCVCLIRKLSRENFRGKISLIIFFRENYTL